MSKNLLSIFTLLPRLIKSTKKWLIADGKFDKDRAITLIVFFLLLLLGISLIGVDRVVIAIGLLLDVSDAIGVAE